MAQSSATRRGTQHAADKTAIPPFHVNVPETELAELRRRISTKRPEQETIADPFRGVQLAKIQPLELGLVIYPNGLADYKAPTKRIAKSG